MDHPELEANADFKTIIPVLSEIVGALIAVAVGAACVREMINSGYRYDLLLLAALSFAVVPFLLRRAYRTARDIRELVEEEH